jgi:hypothetical protein
MNRVRWILLIALYGSVARAADVMLPGEEKVTVTVGAHLQAFRSTVRVDKDQAGTGDRVDLGSDLGVDQSTTGGWLGAEWRFAPRHRLGIGYTRFTVRGERAIDRQLVIGDEVFPVGARLAASQRLEILPLTYSYSALKRDDRELALVAGLHWSRTRFQVEGSASFGARDASNDASLNINVPMPLIGVRYDHHFSERWSAGASATFFALRFSAQKFDYQGSLAGARLYGEYRFSRHGSVGAALDGFRETADATLNSGNAGLLEYSYLGPQLYLTARF